MNPVEPATPVQILLVEDDPGDVLMTREALRQQTAPLRYKFSTTASRRYVTCGENPPTATRSVLIS